MFQLSSDSRVGIRPRKVGFLYPRRKTEFIIIIPFGPKNKSFFYTVMMKILHDQWVILFNSTKYIVPLDTSVAKIFRNSKTNIDATLFYSNHIPTLLYYFSCVAQVLYKYRLSFKMSKCDFFLPHIESIILFSPNLISLNNRLSNHIMYLFSLLLACVHSTIIMSHGLNQI